MVGCVDVVLLYIDYYGDPVRCLLDIHVVTGWRGASQVCARVRRAWLPVLDHVLRESFNFSFCLPFCLFFLFTLFIYLSIYIHVYTYLFLNISRRVDRVLSIEQLGVCWYIHFIFIE